MPKKRKRKDEIVTVVEVMPKDFSEREIEKTLQYKRITEAVLNNDNKEIDKIIEELVDNKMKKVVRKLKLHKSTNSKSIGRNNKKNN